MMSWSASRTRRACTIKSSTFRTLALASVSTVSFQSPLSIRRTRRSEGESAKRTTAASSVTPPLRSWFTTSSTRGRLLPNPRKLISSSSTAECFRLPFAGEGARGEGDGGLPEEPFAPAPAAAPAAAAAARDGTKTAAPRATPLDVDSQVDEGPSAANAEGGGEAAPSPPRCMCLRACAREKGEAGGRAGEGGIVPRKNF